MFASAPPATLAQPYPNRPIRMVVPFPPGGGGADMVARVVSQKISTGLGQAVIIDNRPGGNTIIGAELVAKSQPDGYTLLLAIDSTFTMNPSIYKTLPYTLATDFAPISLITYTSLLIAANPKLPVRSVRELVAYAKANPGKVNLGSGALSAQLGFELFKLTTGTNIVYVPFKGSGPTLQALLAGDIDLSLADISSFAPAVREGRLIGLATTGRKRESSLPNVPTVMESGYPDFEIGSWFGIFAPGGTPPGIIARIHAELVKSLTTPEAKIQFLGMGREVIVNTPEELSAQIRAEAAKWDHVIKSAGLKFE